MPISTAGSFHLLLIELGRHAPHRKALAMHLAENGLELRGPQVSLRLILGSKNLGTVTA